MTPTYKPASVQIKVINSGFLDDELGQALSEATRKVLEHGKNATVTLKLTIAPQNIAQGTVKISHDIASKLPKEKLPKEKREGGIVFVTPEGNIQADDPVQGKLNLVGTGSADKKPLKFAAA